MFTRLFCSGAFGRIRPYLRQGPVKLPVKFPRRKGNRTLAKPRQRSDGRWVIEKALGIGKRQRRWFYGATKRECEQNLADAIAREGGHLRETNRGTVGAFMTRWLAEVDR